MHHENEKVHTLRKRVVKEVMGEITNIVAFLLKRISTRVLKKKSPFKDWFGYKLDLQF